MAGLREKSFAERRSSAMDKKQEQLKNYQARLASPEMKAQEAARRAIVDARNIRNAEREAIRAKEREAEEAARAERELILEAEREIERQKAEEAKAADAAAALARASRVISDEVARKAARDAKYAARKARKL
ncbi:MAG: DUF6481 family protein [Beijerinckiaceae bacterium]